MSSIAPTSSQCPVNVLPVVYRCACRGKEHVNRCELCHAAHCSVVSPINAHGWMHVGRVQVIDGGVWCLVADIPWLVIFPTLPAQQYAG